MNSYDKLNQLFINQKNNLCVGLDPDYTKLPQGFEQNPDGIYNFLVEIINATKDIAIAYKINFAFYEVFGSKGIEIIEKILPKIPADKFTIADVKRSDIGNSSKFYAESVYKHFGFDAATLNPLMGADSVEPFFKYTDKLNFVLALTSNPGAKDFLNNYNFFPNLFREIIRKFTELYSEKNLGFVAAGIKPEETMNVRLLAPNYILLIPGIGAQGGDLKQINTKKIMPAIFNVSRDIIFPDAKEDYFKAVREKAIEYSKLMAL
ncbi:MAG: orotidine-5'-phosphate decarboxylase [Candidatus Kapabacteria bacterium]|nr:orotidine-5'-phosphate decarboxylase [Candidatus Kapabacteria bacterium]